MIKVIQYGTALMTMSATMALADVQVVIMDNAGTLQQPGKIAIEAKKSLLHRLSIDGAGFFQDDQIAVILTASGAVEYRDNASNVPATIGKLLPYLKAQNVCNDLVAAIDEAAMFLRGVPAKDVKGAGIHIFSSLIHTPGDCEGYVANVPQNVPEDLDLVMPPQNSGVNE